uniref:FRIGIDA-like protein n=1 Tax=Arundo donax TaxID=35708 RepID=A0A0A9D002_ARUDO
MTPTADLEAAIGKLRAKMDALREAFDHLAACSPYPLPFAWKDLSAHISAIESSISRRFHQLRVLEASRPADTGKIQKGASEEEEEEEGEVEKGDEVVVEEEAEKEMHYAGDKIGNLAKDCEEAGEDEEDEEPVATKVSAGQDEAESEDQEADEDAQEEEEEQDAEEEAQEEEEEEQDAKEEAAAKKMTKKQRRRAPPGGSKDLVAACARMDARTLVKFVCCTSVALKKEFPVAMRHAPDAAGLALQVVKLFLSSNKFKSTKVWLNCVMLICCVPVVAAKPSADIIEQAKLVAKDWKQMIDKPEFCGDLDLLAAWGLLHFLISYNIVSEFHINEIICIFGMVPHKWQKNNTIQLCKSLGLANRITDLIDYLIGNGQHLEVFHLAHVFNLVNEYPVLSLLKGYVEKAKQTAVEIFRKNITRKSLSLATSKEVKNLWVAHHLAKKKISDSTQRSVIMAEIKNLLDEYAKKRSLADPSTVSTTNPEQQPKKEKQSNKKRKKEQSNKKRKKGEEEHHDGQGSQQQNKLQEKQHKQENKAQVTQKQQQQQNKPQETPQQHIKRPRPCTLKLPTPAISVVPNVTQIRHFGRIPDAAIPGVHIYPAQPGWPGTPQNMSPLCNPFYPHNSPYPR